LIAQIDNSECDLCSVVVQDRVIVLTLYPYRGSFEWWIATKGAWPQVLWWRLLCTLEEFSEGMVKLLNYWGFFNFFLFSHVENSGMKLQSELTLRDRRYQLTRVTQKRPNLQ
jgi:hypothetical protein